MAHATFASPRPGNTPERLRLLQHSRAPGLVDDPHLADLADLAARLSGARVAALELLGDTESVWVARTGTDLLSMDAGQALSALLVQDPADLVVDDLARDPRTAELSLLAEEGYRSCAAVPFTHPSGVVLGAVVVLSDARAAFGREVLPSLHVLARQAWTVISWTQSRPTLSDALQARRGGQLVSA